MADQEVKVVVTVDANQAQTALKSVSGAAAETAKQTEKVAESTQKSHVQIGQFGSALGLAGQAAGKLNPALGGIVTMAGSATGVIQGLTTAGLGPLGIALGVASVALSVFASNQADAADKSKQYTERLDANTRSLQSFINKLREEKELRETTARLRAGGGTSEEYQAEIRRLEDRRRIEIETYGTTSAVSRVLIGNIDAAIARAYQMQQLVEQAGPVEEIEIENLPTLTPGTPAFAEWARANNRDPVTGAPLRQTGGGGGGGGARREERPYSYEGSGDARRDIERENRWIEKEEQESNARQLEDLNNFLSESADIANYYREREREEEEKQKKALAEIQQKAEDERLEAAKRTKELILETSMESLDTVLSAFDEAATANLEAMLTGGKMTAKATREMVKETMLALTTESIVQGLKQTALGLGALAMGSPSAALHFASAAKFAAVGVAAGVAGAAAGGFKGVGQESDTAAPAAATGGPALSSGATGAMASTVVINWGSSGLVYAADRAQLGRDIAGMIGEANSRLGRGM